MNQFSRSRGRNAKGNVLRYVLPGLTKAIDIPFSERKLPVCKRCKKIYKSRELCRIRDGHTEVPWNTTYLCVTLDESCLKPAKDGSPYGTLVDEDSFRFVARNLPGPSMALRAKKGHLGGAKAPICMACKDKNYTRHHCREKQQHLQLPWGTVYVMISAVPFTGPDRIGYFTDQNPPSSTSGGSSNEAPSIGSKRSCDSSSISSETETSLKKQKSEDTSSIITAPTEDESVDASNNEEQLSDNLHKVEQSKTFLLTIKQENCVLRVSDFC